jgi:hypothetical protein
MTRSSQVVDYSLAHPYRYYPLRHANEFAVVQQHATYHMGPMLLMGYLSSRGNVDGALATQRPATSTTQPRRCLDNRKSASAGPEVFTLLCNCP